jgi:hypothetical protein
MAKGAQSLSSSSHASADGAWPRLARWWRGLGERQRLRREFASLAAQGELDAVLGDAGASRSHLDAILKASPESPRRLAAMLQRLGITRTALRTTGALHEVEMNCTLCRDGGACDHWLKSGARTGQEAFCPNAATLAQAKRVTGRS